jgi:hypothetical protein
MSEALLSTLPLMLGSALIPIWIILVLLLLRSPNGLARAIAFVAGTTTVRLAQGVVFGLLFGASQVGGEKTQESSPVVSTLLLVVGILLLITALKALCKEPDPDAPPPQWMTLMDSTSPLTVFGLGAGFTLVAVKLWVFTLSAIGIIREANLSWSESITAFLIYVLGAQSLILLPLLLYAIVPHQSATLLQSITRWLEKYNRPITIAVSLIFGSLFLWKGVAGLIQV